MKRRDLLIGSIALLGSAAVAGSGTAYALSSIVPKPPAPPEPATPEVAAAVGTHGAPAAAAPASSGHGAAPAAAGGHGPAPAAAPAGPHWDYEGADHWGDLEPSTAVCKQGGAQSPIDLDNAMRVPALPGLQLSYGQTRVKLVNNGHTFQVNCDKGSSLTLHGKKFDLLQFHFHTPSEHTIEGKAYPLELHLVHQASDKNLAVIGVMLAEGAPNLLLTKFWERLPKSEGEVETGVSIAVQDLLPRNFDDYFTYSGSLTTPPCTESVRWIVLKRSVEVSKAQIAAFRAVFPMNARPVQPLGARIVLTS